MCLVDFLRFSCLACLFLFVNGDRSDSSDLVGDDHTLKIMPTIWQWLGFQTSFTEDGDEFVPVRSSMGNEHPFVGRVSIYRAWEGYVDLMSILWKL